MTIIPLDPGAQSKRPSLSPSVQPTIWPGEPVVMMLEDLEFQWKRGRLPNLLPAVELVMLAVMNADSPVKVRPDIPTDGR